MDFCPSSNPLVIDEEMDRLMVQEILPSVFLEI